MRTLLHTTPDRLDPADLVSVWRLPFTPATMAVAIAAFLGGLLALGPPGVR